MNALSLSVLASWRSIRGLLILGCFLMGASGLHAGTWPQEKGGGYFKLGLRLTTARNFYNEIGNRVAIHPYSDFSSNVYGEYGLFKQITLVASVPFYRYVWVTRERPVLGGGSIREVGANAGFADPEVGVRVGLTQFQSWVISTEILLGLPIGDDQDVNNLLIGDGEFNQIIKLQIGHSFYPNPLYFSVEIGFNNRTQGFSDEIRYGAEIGYTFEEKLLVNLKFRGIRSLKNGDPFVVGSRNSPNNQSSLIYAPEVNYFLKPNLGLSASVEGSVLEENFISGGTFSLGAFLTI